MASDASVKGADAASGSRRAKTRTRPDGAIRFKTGFRNTIYAVLKARGWKETDGCAAMHAGSVSRRVVKSGPPLALVARREMDWDIHWAEREWVYEVFDHIHLDSWQRVNHFRNGREVRGVSPRRHRGRWLDATAAPERSCAARTCSLRT